MSKTCEIPPDSWDTHVHVFDPVEYPYSDEAAYFPPARSSEQLVSETPSQNYVIVMSGPEGTNTSLTIDTIAKLRGEGHKAHGTVVMDVEDMSVEVLQRLNEGGVRGVRFNTRRDGDNVTKLAQTFTLASEKFAEAKVTWNVDAAIFDYRIWASLVPDLRRLHCQYGTVFVADHLWAAPANSTFTPEMDTLMDALSEGVIVVKVSGMYRYGRKPQELIPLVRRVLSQRDGKSGIWGSDWPYVDSTPSSTSLFKVNIWEHLEVLKSVADEFSEKHWERLMRDNAASLFDN